MSPGELVVRPVERRDAAAIVELVSLCFEEYREFAPADWNPPVQGDALERVEAAIAMPRSGGAVAEDGGTHAGQVLWIPAALSPNYESDDPSVAYLSQLFLAPGYRGSGLAARLLGWAIRSAGELGYREVRLLTPKGQSRARAFYAREGWTELGDWGVHSDLRLPLVEYGRRL
jgi:GNAT superfamily N-acetyltransferase